MRKTKRKSLTLSRETLCRLEDASLGRVVGGTLSELTDCHTCDPDDPDDPQPTSAPSFCPCVR